MLNERKHNFLYYVTLQESERSRSEVSGVLPPTPRTSPQGEFGLGENGKSSGEEHRNGENGNIPQGESAADEAVQEYGTLLPRNIPETTGGSSSSLLENSARAADSNANAAADLEREIVNTGDADVATTDNYSEKEIPQNEEISVNVEIPAPSVRPKTYSKPSRHNRKQKKEFERSVDEVYQDLITELRSKLGRTDESESSNES